MNLYFVDEDRTWEIPPGESVIGRGLECALALDPARFPEISRRHVTLIADGLILRFRDEGGANGTMKNHVRLSAGELRDGDVLQLGNGGPKFEIRRTLAEAAADEITRVSSMPAVQTGSQAATTLTAQPLSDEGMTRVMFTEPKTKVSAKPATNPDIYKTTVMSSTSTTPTEDHDADEGFVPPPLPDVSLTPAVDFTSEFFALEQKLKTMQSMLAAALILALIPIGLLFYQSREIDANREAILAFQHQANSSVSLLLPEVDARMKHLDDRLDSIDPKLQRAEDHMVERMNRDLPIMMDRYMNSSVNTLEKTHPELAHPELLKKP